MQLKPLVAAAILAAGAIASPAASARADETDCVKDAIKECNKEFPPSDYYNISIRGWCYVIHIAICNLF